MDDIFSLSCLGGHSTAQAAQAILACNNISAARGLTLTRGQAIALAQTRETALKESKRLELGGSAVVEKLIAAFCTSPYIEKADYAATLHELIALFYDLKNATWDKIPDDELICFMQQRFDTCCGGSLDMLCGEGQRLAAHIHRGGSLGSYLGVSE